MLGLIKKNLYLSIQRSKWMFCLLGLYLVIGLFSGGADIVFMLLPILSGVEAANAAAYDATCEWDLYASALPVTRRQTVLAQYITGYLLIAAGSAVSLIGSLIYIRFTGGSIAEPLASILGMTVFALLYLSVVTPVVYKFGIEKLRMVMMLMMIGMGILIYAVISVTKLSIVDFVPYLPLIGITVIALAVVVCVGSVFLSMKIYENKEL